MFILHGTMETLPAEDNKGRSFTQILSSVCEENGGAVDILDIAEYVSTWVNINVFIHISMVGKSTIK